MASARSLTDVPEEHNSRNFTPAFGPVRASSPPPYTMPSPSTSTSSLHPDRLNGRSSMNSLTQTARRTSSFRSIAATAADLQGSGSSSPAGTANGNSGNSGSETPTQVQAQSSRNSLRRASSTTSTINGSSSGHSSNPSVLGAGAAPPGSSTPRQSSSTRHRDRDRADVHIPRMRSTPRLVCDKEAEAAPSTGMYWSRAPVYGAIPSRTMRAHSVTLVDNVVWLFGGCDERESWRDVYCLDIETLQWSHPECLGDTPPPSRAHSATLVDRKIVFIGGGHASTYYDSVYILDTTARRWSRPTIAPGPTPPQRRAHTAVLSGNKIWVFGGGNGMVALNDVWTLDVSGLMPYGMYPYGAGGYGGYSHGGYQGGNSCAPGLGRSSSGRNKDGSVTTKWELVETKGVKKPGPRGYHTANLIGNVMVVIGGSDGKDSFDELWTLDLDSRVWTQIKTNMPYKRLAHSSTQVGSYLFIFGGHDSTEYTSELVLLNLVSLQYESRTVYGKMPAPRGYHAAVLADSRLFLIGGFNGLTSFDDVQILELAASAYLPQVTSFVIEALVP